MGPGRRDGVLRAGQHLDVETQSALALADQLGKRQAGEAAQVLDDPTQRAQAVERHLRDPLTRSAPRQAAGGRSSSASTMLARSELSGAWSRASPTPG